MNPMNSMNPNMTPQQAAMFRQQMQQAQQNPQIAAQMQAQRAAILQRQQQQMALAQAQAYGGMPGAQQHLQPGFPQQRRPSPMGQMQMGQPGQPNHMVGFGGMPPPTSGPMGGNMQGGMHPQQQAFQQQQQQYMQGGNPQFAGGMNPMMSMSPMPPSTPNRPPSQVQLTPSPAPQPGTPTNAGPQNGLTPPNQQPPGNMMGNMMANQSVPMQQAQTPSKTAPSVASDNGESKSEQDSGRIEILLELNSLIIRCIMDLDKAKNGGSKPDGQAGGQQSPTSSTPTDPNNPVNGGNMSPTQATQPQQQNSAEWLQFMRRLQANIAYLMGQPVGTGTKKKALWPPFMDIHPITPDAVIPEETYKQLRDLYQRLKEAIPEYKPGLNPITGLPAAMNKPPGMMGPPGQQGQAPRAAA